MTITGTRTRPARRGRFAAQRGLRRSLDHATELDGPDPIAPTSLTARDLQRWADGARVTLWDRRIAIVFARGADLGRADPASWISVVSATASGRLIRQGDGRSERHARRHTDGLVVMDATSDRTTLADLWELIDALAPGTRSDERRSPW